MIVLDGAGIGALPDAVLYGDEHSNTIGNVAKRVSLAIPTLRALGLGSLVELGGSCPARRQAAIGKMAEASAGKDSVTGHWELMGVTTTHAFPVFPNGFPESSINENHSETLEKHAS
jgi:phosphopentomutase